MADLQLQPLGSRILVKPEIAEETTSAGIMIAPTASKERPQRGEVVALGVNADKDSAHKFTVKVGDTVMFKQYGPEEFEVGEEEKLLVMDESDVLAIIK